MVYVEHVFEGQKRVSPVLQWVPIMGAPRSGLVGAGGGPAAGGIAFALAMVVGLQDAAEDCYFPVVVTVDDSVRIVDIDGDNRLSGD